MTSWYEMRGRSGSIDLRKPHEDELRLRVNRVPVKVYNFPGFEDTPFHSRRWVLVHFVRLKCLSPNVTPRCHANGSPVICTVHCPGSGWKNKRLEGPERIAVPLGPPHLGIPPEAGEEHASRVPVCMSCETVDDIVTHLVVCEMVCGHVILDCLRSVKRRTQAPDTDDICVLVQEPVELP